MKYMAMELCQLQSEVSVVGFGSMNVLMMLSPAT